MLNRTVSHQECLKARPERHAASRIASRNAATPGAGDWLSLAAAPTFAGMALLTVLGGNDPAEILCSAGHGASPLTGMAAMYLLMSAFHLAPWLKLIASRRGGARQP